MGALAIGGLLFALGIGLAFAGGGGGPTFPSPPVVMVALCRAMAELGQTAPQPALERANVDLAIRAIKVLRLGGSWPPSRNDPAAKQQWFAAVVDLAARVRAGEIVCRDREPSDGDGGTSDGDGDGGTSDSNLPGRPAFTLALCQALEELGQTAPLPPLGSANVDLAVRAIKLLGVGGSWPPSRSAPSATRSWWQLATELAAAVRSGEIDCREAGDVPTLAAIQEAICQILLPLADPEEHYLERGSLPAEAAGDVALAAIESLGALPGALPAPLVAAATAYALDVIEGRTICGFEDRVIAPGDFKGPGRWYQIEGDGAGPMPDDTLVTVVGNTYGVTGARRLELARVVNRHPYNLGLHVPTGNAWNAANIGPTMVSFFPRWRRDPKTIRQRYESGNAYAVIYLPEL